MVAPTDKSTPTDTDQIADLLRWLDVRIAETRHPAPMTNSFMEAGANDAYSKVKSFVIGDRPWPWLQPVPETESASVSLLIEFCKVMDKWCEASDGHRLREITAANLALLDFFFDKAEPFVKGLRT